MVGEGEANTSFDGVLDGLLRVGLRDTTAPDDREGAPLAYEGDDRGMAATHPESAETRADTPGNESTDGDLITGLFGAGAGIEEILSTGTPSSAATCSTDFFARSSSVRYARDKVGFALISSTARLSFWSRRETMPLLTGFILGSRASSTDIRYSASLTRSKTSFPIRYASGPKRQPPSTGSPATEAAFRLTCE